MEVRYKKQLHLHVLPIALITFGFFALTIGISANTALGSHQELNINRILFARLLTVKRGSVLPSLDINYPNEIDNTPAADLPDPQAAPLTGVHSAGQTSQFDLLSTNAKQ